MSFLEEIKKQPQHIRELMFGLCVVTTISLVGMVWYSSFQKDMYALLNPGESAESDSLAENNRNSLFGNIFEAGKNLKATFYSLFDLTAEEKKDNPIIKKDDQGKVYLLPLSGEK